MPRWQPPSRRCDLAAAARRFEVVGRDGSALQRFYSDLFGWKMEVMPEMNYGIVEAGEGGIGGGIGQVPNGDGHVTAYAAVDDPQAQEPPS